MTWQSVVRAAVSELEPQARALAAELIAVPSVGGSSAERDVQHLTADWLRGHGLQVDAREVPVPRDASGFPGMEVPRDTLVRVVASLPAEVDGPDLCLVGHTDVVPSAAADAFAPRWADGRLWGRGAADMKAGVAAACVAAAALARCRLDLRGRLVVAPVSAEEDGGAGTFALLSDGLGSAPGSAAIIAEPTDGRIFTANAGCLTFQITLRGRAAHGALRWRGVNPLEHVGAVLDALRALEAERCAGAGELFAPWPLAYPISVGTIRAGDWASTVPAEVTMTGRYGVRLDEPFEDAQRDFEAALARVADADPWLARHPPQVAWWGARFAGTRTAADHPVVTALREAGAPAQVLGAPYGSDQRLLNAAGIPTVLFGPGRPVDAHSDPESVDWAQVMGCAEALALASARFLGAGGPVDNQG